MKKILIGVCIGVLSLGLACQPGQQDKKEVLAKIDSYELCLDDFECRLAEDMELDGDFKLTREAKATVLDQLIQKELLIQEAKRLKLDQEEKFIRSIENYWESTLIRNLMDIKGEEITKRVTVTEEDILDRYAQMKQREGGSVPPIEDVREKIEKDIVEEIRLKRLQDWMRDLRQKAKIEISEELLAK